MHAQSMPCVQDLNLPNIAILLQSTPFLSCWKKWVIKILELKLTYTCWTRRRQMRPRTIIHVCSELLLLCLENDPLQSSDPPDIKIKFQNPPPSGLESDGSRFSMRKDGQSLGDPSCKLCGSALEDATHFRHHAWNYIASCFAPPKTLGYGSTWPCMWAW